MAQPVKLSEPRRIDRDSPRYELIEAPSANALVKRVDLALADGWHCIGGPIYRAQDGFFIQAVGK
jgi:hypothetical protein